MGVDVELKLLLLKLGSVVNSMLYDREECRDDEGESGKSDLLTCNRFFVELLVLLLSGDCDLGESGSSFWVCTPVEGGFESRFWEGEAMRLLLLL